MRHTAGLLPYTGGGASADRQVFLVHPGGPFWRRKDRGAWSLAKGEFDPDLEDPRAAAHREFTEEVGIVAPAAVITELGVFVLPSRKRLYAFAVEVPAAQQGDVRFVESNTFELEWPPRSGRRARFPEVDDARWFPLDEALDRITVGQRPILAALPTQ